MATLLENLFTEHMFELYEKAKKQYKYSGRYFLRKIKAEGGLTAAKMVLRHKGTNGPLPPGLIAMVERGGLEATVEAAVIQDRWHSLFTNTELQIARERLARYGYTFGEKPKPSMPITIGEISDDSLFPEGSKKTIIVNAYERNHDAREKCIEKYGTRCYVCRMSFEERYGEKARDFIHVHHLSKLSSVGEKYLLNPETDLRPVCPNCHAVIHMQDPPFSIEQVRQMLNEHKR